MSRLSLVCLIVMVTVLFRPQLTLSDEPAADKIESAKASPLRRLIDDSLTWFELTTDTAAKPMTPRVVMRWANNIRGSESGATVLYLHEGVPQAVCSIYPWDQKLIHEFDSLSRTRLEAKYQERVVWTPSEPGGSFCPMPMSDAPADSPSMRLRQMKSLAAQFSCTMLGWRADRTDRETLRLLPQPLYRYETQSSSGLVDGAVFAFVMGTDPEALLLLEAVRNQNGIQWEYAFVRQTSGALESKLGDTVVWTVEAHPASKLPTNVHFSQGLSLPADVRESLKAKE